MHFSYWGCNQYIIQRALAAKSLADAQNGILFAAAIKIIMPLIVVVPGIAAVLLVPDLSTPDQAYPQMMNLVPSGVKGLVFAALIAAILSSLGSMINSISTIATIDLYKHFRPESNENHLVVVGRMVAVAALVIAMILAQPLLGEFEQAFQFIQEFTGFFTPGIVTLFLLGLFWKRMNANGAIAAASASFVVSGAFWMFWPSLPFIDRVGIVFLLCITLGAGISLIWRSDDSSFGNLNAVSFRTSTAYNVGALAVGAVLFALYVAWW
jgi:SSS family solute:Na+ symporter